MVGIVSCGAYVPLFRLASETAGWNRPGERSVANFDEDSVTMAVAAARDCLRGVDRSKVDALFFATTTPPYAERQGAVTIAMAADLRPDVLTTDYAHSLRAGTLALKAAADAIAAGSAEQVLVVAADSRLAAPRSNLEQNSGDGAAAILLGKSGVAAELLGGHFVASEILDVWRPSNEGYLRSWEDRFILDEGYFKLLPAAASGAAQRLGLTPKDIARAAIYAPDARRHREMARALGLGAEQVQEPFFGLLGNTGAAFALMLLVAALEGARPGDKIMVANYGDGADCLVFRATDGTGQAKGGRGLKGYLESRCPVDNYETYLSWRGIYEPDTGTRRPVQLGPSAASLHRERDEVLRLYGVRCNACATVQYPPQRVCTRCHSKDNFERVKLADRAATLYTYAMDYIAGTKDVPLVVCIINFEGGGRMLCTMTDRDPNDIRVGMPLEMSFRRLFSADGIHNYYWKAIPVRA